MGTPKASTPRNSPPLKPVKSLSSGGHNRSISAPILQPPFISIEDVTQPLETAEDSHQGTPSRQNSSDTDSSSTDSSTKRTNGAANKKSGAAGGAGERRRSSAWNHRKRSPNVGWKKKWDQEHHAFRDGRLLIVDCFSRDFSDDGKRKTQAYEFERISELQDFYATGPGRKDGGQCLRIIHVQNAVWARDFLLKKFNISSKSEDVVGTAFGRWVKYDKPQLRAGKPVLNAKSFRCIKDPWRGVSRTGFGVDYLKSFRPGVIKDYSEPAVKGFKLMDLNHWDEGTGTVPVHGYDVYVQRLSVYVQRREGMIDLHPLDAELRNPYIELAHETAKERTARKSSVHLTDADDAVVGDEEEVKMGIPKTGSLPLPTNWEGNVFELLSSLDNGSTIIVFESSHTNRHGDTLIQAREEIEVRWRRLMLYLNREDQSEDILAMECMDLVLRDIFKGLQMSWERTLSKCEAHVSILEDKVYENPADESRAAELWGNSALWLKLEKLISLHTVTINDLKQQMRDLSETEEYTKEDWFKDIPSDLERVAKLFDEEMMKPTANLSDLLYKSVGIRDSRHSLQLGTSMWRLSWITFVFLPLTFMVGFFGMNVDTFQPSGGYPSIKWYFVWSIPLMLLIMAGYLFIKSSLSTSHDIPMQRGAYEQIFTQFADDHPQLWSRSGPKSWVKPKGIFGRLKWRIVKMWFDPARTIARKTFTEIDEMGLWARVKRGLAQRWLGQIETHPLPDEEYGAEGEFSTLTELLQMSAPVAMADAWPGVADAPSSPPLGRVFSRRSRSSSGSRPPGGRTASPGAEMVVEEEKSDDDGSGGGSASAKDTGRSGKKKEKRPEGTDSATTSLFSSGMLNVPFASRRVEEHIPE